jgi:hypothetical protein
LEKELANHKVLEKYLLGELDEKERSEIAERYFEDDDLFEELLVVETELLDKLACGLLNEKEQQAFKQYLDKLPEGQQKLAVARAMHEFTDEDRARADQLLKEYVPVSVSWWRSVLPLPSSSPARLQYIMVAGLVVLVVGLLFLFIQFRQLRHDNDQLRAQVSNLQNEKVSLEEAARTSRSDVERIRQLEEQLKLEQQTNDAQAEHLASLQPTEPVTVSWELTPPLRSMNQPDSVALPRSVKFVSLTLPVEIDSQLLNARAVIQTTTGQQRREAAGLRVNKAGKSVSFKLPASYFTETSYKLTLVQQDKDNQELSQDFYFTVTRR